MAERVNLDLSTARRMGEVTKTVEGMNLGATPPPKNPRRPGRQPGVAIFLGRATEDTENTEPTFAVTVDYCIQRPDPRTDPNDTGEAVTVKNTFMQGYLQGDRVWCQTNKDGTHEAFKPGGGSAASAYAESSATFELTEELIHSLNQAQARLLDQNGNVITPPTTDVDAANEQTMLNLTEGNGPGEIPVNGYARRLDTNRAWQYTGGGTSDIDNWTDVGPAKAEIFVVDKTKQGPGPPLSRPSGFVGLPEYTDANGTTQRAYRGEAKWVKVEEVDTGTPSAPDLDTWSFYEIVWMEGEADELEVQFIDEPPIVPDYPTEPDNESEIPVNIIRAWGSNGNNRMPKQFTLRDTTDGFAIYDNAWYTSGEIDGNIITVKKHHETGKYYPTRASTFKGIAEISTEVTGATKTGAVMSLGFGEMKIYSERNPPEEGKIEQIVATTYKIWSQAPGTTPVDKDISFAVKRGRRLIDVEPCENLTEP